MNEKQFEVRLIVTTKNINPNNKVNLEELTNKIISSALELIEADPEEILLSTDEGADYYRDTEQGDIEFIGEISSISEWSNPNIKKDSISDHNIVKNIKLTIF